jgi:hypothetical protein
VFAVDEHGMLSRDAEKMLRKCIVAREDRQNVEGHLSTWSRRTFSAFWRQRLSITLVRRLASVIMLHTQRDYRLGQVVCRLLYCVCFSLTWITVTFIYEYEYSNYYLVDILALTFTSLKG